MEQQIRVIANGGIGKTYVADIVKHFRVGDEHWLLLRGLFKTSTPTKPKKSKKSAKPTPKPARISRVKAKVKDLDKMLIRLDRLVKQYGT